MPDIVGPGPVAEGCFISGDARQECEHHVVVMGKVDDGVDERRGIE